MVVVVKRIFFGFISLALFLSITGCEDRSVFAKSAIGSDTNATEMKHQNSGKILVVYFTMPESDGIDALSGASRIVEKGTVLGNTQWVAGTISELTGGTLFAIKTVQDYPGSHEALLNQGQIEKRNNARPKLKTHISNMDEYDVVFIGYPIWWYTLPMPLYSFIEEYDLSGKTIIPFSTHGGSRFSGTIKIFSRLLTEASVIKNGFTVSRDDVQGSRDDIIDWLRELGYQPVRR